MDGPNRLHNFALKMLNPEPKLRHQTQACPTSKNNEVTLVVATTSSNITMESTENTTRLFPIFNAPHCTASRCAQTLDRPSSRKSAAISPTSDQALNDNLIIYSVFVQLSSIKETYRCRDHGALHDFIAYGSINSKYPRGSRHFIVFYSNCELNSYSIP